MCPPGSACASMRVDARETWSGTWMCRTINMDVPDHQLSTSNFQLSTFNFQPATCDSIPQHADLIDLDFHHIAG